MKKHIYALILMFLVITVLFSPFLFKEKIFADADAVLQTYPLYFLRSSAKSVNWIPQMLGGHHNEIWADYFSLNTVFVKINQLVNNHVAAYHWMVFLYFCLGGLFCYLLSKKLNFSNSLALVISLCYILSEFCFYRGRLAVNSGNFFFLPLLFYLLIKMQENRKLFVSITGIVIGVFIWIGNAQYILYILIAGLFLVFYLDWQRYDCVKPFLQNWQMFKNYVLVGLISLLISFPFLYETLNATKFTSFNSGFTSSSSANSSGIALIDLFRFLSPYLYFDGFSNIPALLYTGTFSFLLLLIGIFYGMKKNAQIAISNKKENERAAMARFFTFLFVFFLLMAFKYSPLFYFFSRIPLINRFRNQSRFIFIVVFAGAILVGYGLQYLLEKKQNISKFVNILKKIVVFSVFGVLFSNILSRLWIDKIIALANKYFDQRIYNVNKQFSLPYYHQIINLRIRNYFYLFDIGNMKFLIPFVFLLIGYLLLELYQREKITLKNFEIACAAIVVLNFILIYPMYHQTITQAEYLEEPQTISFIKTQETNPFEYRVFGFRLSDFLYRNVTVPSEDDPKILVKFQQETIVPNTNLVFNIQSLDGYDHFMQERNSLFIGQIGSDESVIQEITPLLNREDLSSEEKIELFISRINLLALFNVKYIVTPHKLETLKINLVDEEKVTDLQVPIYIYEIKNFMPRVYFAKDIEFVKVDNKSGLQLLLDNADKVLDKTFVECGDCDNNELLKQVQHDALTAIPALRPSEAESEGGKAGIQVANIEIQKYEAGYLETEVNISESRWLVFNENNIEGWKAYIDGQQTDIYAANYLMQGIFIPQGNHKIIFKFQ